MMRKFGLISSLLAFGIGQAYAQAVAPGVADFDFCGARRVWPNSGQRGRKKPEYLRYRLFLRSYLGLKPNENEYKQLLIK